MCGSPHLPGQGWVACDLIAAIAVVASANTLAGTGEVAEVGKGRPVFGDTGTVLVPVVLVLVMVEPCKEALEWTSIGRPQFKTNNVNAKKTTYFLIIFYRPILKVTLLVFKKTLAVK